MAIYTCDKLDCLVFSSPYQGLLVALLFSLPLSLDWISYHYIKMKSNGGSLQLRIRNWPMNVAHSTHDYTAVHVLQHSSNILQSYCIGCTIGLPLLLANYAGMLMEKVLLSNVIHIYLQANTALYACLKCKPEFHYVQSTYLSFSSASRLSRKWCSCRYWQTSRTTSRSSILWPDHQLELVWSWAPGGGAMGGTSSGHVTTFKHSSAEVGGDLARTTGLAWVEEMSESAGTLSDAFSGAVERVVRLHQTQVYGEFCNTEEWHITS